tara:strand:- start:16876 stop:17811 length:936 start_codon:yes stop_codon:yes gene_type:complete
MKSKFLLFGIASIFPGIFKFFAKPTGGTSSAEYCYSVWLRHLIVSNNNGLKGVPSNVAEIGPGDTLGIGFAALLSGADTYTAFDVHQYATKEKNIEIFNELVWLFKNKSNIPCKESNSRIRPKLNDYSFPTYILSKEILDKSLADERINKIRNSILNINSGCISYYVPWSGTEIKENSIDFIIAQASLEYINNVKEILSYIRLWLKQDALASLVIDYSSHHLSKKWNEHWTYSELLWSLLKGGQPFFPNRMTHTDYLDLYNDCKFEILASERNKKQSAIERKDLNQKFKKMSEEDLNTAGGFFVIKKKLLI